MYKLHAKIIVLLALVFYAALSFAQSTPTTGTTTDAIQMLQHLSRAYPAIWKLLTALSYIIGFALAMRAIYYLKVYGELRTMMASQSSLKTPIVFIIVSAVLISLPTTFHYVNQTLFGYSSPLAYDNQATGATSVFTQALVGLVQIVGLISFIKGWMILVANAQHSGGQASFGKAMTHIIGGALAINVTGLVNIIWSTFGLTPPF